MASEYQFGIDDMKVTAWEAAALAATSVDVLGVSSFSLSLEGDSVEHRGDNMSLRVRKTGKRATGSIEQAATNLAAYAVVADGAVVTTGTGPTAVATYTEPTAIGAKQYQIQAQAADVDGSTRFTILRAQTTAGPNFEWAEGEFSNPGWDYEASNENDNLFTIAQYVTEVPLA